MVRQLICDLCMQLTTSPYLCQQCNCGRLIYTAGCAIDLPSYSVALLYAWTNHIRARRAERALHHIGIIHRCREEVRPNAFCTRCSRWGHIAPHCSSTEPRCSICSEKHEATNHRCPVEGCKVGKGRPCPHGTVKCANCGGPHGARADAFAAKKEARVEARGWRPPSPRRQEKGKRPEVPEERTTATQGEEEGEAVVGEGTEG